MRSSMSRDMARQLMAPESTGAPDPVAVQRACTRVWMNLRQSVGDDGYNALLSRVHARTNGEHPAMTSILVVDDGVVRLGDVSAAITAHGVSAVSAAVESMFTALVDVLASLIGADMVLNIVDPDGSRSPAPGKGPTP